MPRVSLTRPNNCFSLSAALSRLGKMVATQAPGEVFQTILPCYLSGNIRHQRWPGPAPSRRDPHHQLSVSEAPYWPSCPNKSSAHFQERILESRGKNHWLLAWQSGGKSLFFPCALHLELAHHGETSASQVSL